jgi:hypothetical protein
LIGNDGETNKEATAVARERTELQWTGWKTVFSEWSALVAAQATMDTATEE